MHRARMFDSAPCDYDWYHPRIRFVRVPRSSLNILGDFEHTFRKLAELAAFRAGLPLPEDETSVFMPAHELQVENIIKRFKDVEVLPSAVYLPALAQSSIRCVRDAHRLRNNLSSPFPGLFLSLTSLGRL